jgi:hypothetical protein
MAEGLIAEIQREAIDDKASVSSLLRKVKLAAAKLNLDTLGSWVDAELTGYPDDVPEYRQLNGAPRYWNQFHGWRPLGGDARIVERLSEVKFGESVANIEALVSSAKSSSTLIARYPPALLQFLSENLKIHVAQAGAEIPVATAIGVLDAVRTAILNWSIEMERAGVHGEGLSFSPVEQRKAQSAPNVFHIGSIGSFTGVMGSENTVGDIISSTINASEVKKFVSQVKANTKSLINEGVDEKQLLACLKSIEAALKNSDVGLIRKGLKGLQDIATNAAGGLVTTGVLSMLHLLLGTGAGG